MPMNMTNLGGNASAMMSGFMHSLQVKKDHDMKLAFMEAQKKLLDHQIKAGEAEMEIKSQKAKMMQQLFGMNGASGSTAPTMPGSAGPMVTAEQASTIPPMLRNPELQVAEQGMPAGPTQPAGGMNIPQGLPGMIARGIVKQEFGIDPGERTYRSGMASPKTGKPITAAFDPMGNIVGEYPDYGAEVEKGKTAFTQENQLREQYNSQTKTFRDVRDAYGRIVKSVEKPSAAGDLALIFNYMKMLDPGSTVREGEFANAQNSGGVPDIVRAQYNKIMSGERLSDTMRTDFYDRSTMLFETANDQYGQTKSEFDRIATGYGLDPRKITIDFNLNRGKNKPDLDMGAAETKVISGVTYIKKGGKWYVSGK